MMKPTIILILTLLSGCNVENENDNVRYNYQAKDKSTIMIGDSLCANYQSTPHLMGIEKDCVAGRTLNSVNNLDLSYKVIYLALGTNDISKGFTAKDYEEKLNSIMLDNVICILPNERQGIETQEHRQAMIDNCPSFVDPVYDCAVSVGDSDGIHYIEQDYIALSECLLEII